MIRKLWTSCLKLQQTCFNQWPLMHLFSTKTIADWLLVLIPEGIISFVVWQYLYQPFLNYPFIDRDDIKNNRFKRLKIDLILILFLIHCNFLVIQVIKCFCFYTFYDYPWLSSICFWTFRVKVNPEKRFTRIQFSNMFFIFCRRGGNTAAAGQSGLDYHKSRRECVGTNTISSQSFFWIFQVLSEHWNTNAQTSKIIVKIYWFYWNLCIEKNNQAKSIVNLYVC